MKKNEILILYGTEYLELTKKLLEEAQLAEMIGDPEKIIGIKPNLVAPVPAEDGGTTHPEVVEGYKAKSADFICGKYNWDKIVQETIKLYQG